MAQFAVFAAVTCSAYTLVEAETAAEALVIAEQRDVVIAEQRDVVIGGNGSGADETESFVIEAADGEPENIRVE